MDAREALQLYFAARTQWRVGFSGAVGLDYVALEIVARTLGISLDTVLPLIQVLENEQMEIWKEEKPDDA